MSQDEVLGDEFQDLDLPVPSIRQHTPLIDSYTYHSFEGQANPEDEEYIMGIDEAGRGPVLGKSFSCVSV